MSKPDRRVALAALGVVAAIAVIVGIVLKSDPGEDEQEGGATTAREATEKQSKTSGDTATDTPAAPQKPKAPAVPTIVVRAGEPVGGVAELTYQKGERARFRVTSDSAEEIHLHGYDIGKDVEAGGSVTFDFTADLEGVFEVELEERATQIAALTVNP
ncbi:MAG: hypothetical protein JST08_09225 [Actinobacteria bacterium]|nr:hypothetical protein [Actinomycetota bacterium]